METGNTFACLRKIAPNSQTYEGQCKTTTDTVLVSVLTDALAAVATALRHSLISMERQQRQDPVTTVSPTACNKEIINITDKSFSNSFSNGDNVRKTSTASSQITKQRPVVSKQQLQRLTTTASSTSPTPPSCNGNINNNGNPNNNGNNDNNDNKNNTSNNKRKKKSTGAEPLQRGKRAKTTLHDPRPKTRQKPTSNTTTAAQTSTVTNTSAEEIVEDVDELQNLVAELIASSESFQGQQNFYSVDPNFVYPQTTNYTDYNNANGFQVKP